MESISIFDVFPHILPENDSFLCFSGYIQIKGHYFEMKIELYKNNTIVQEGQEELLKNFDFTIYGCSKLNKILFNSHAVLKRLFQQSTTLGDFLVELKILLEQLLSQNKVEHDNFVSHRYCERLVNDLFNSNINHNVITGLNMDLNEIKLTVLDSAGREHSIDVFLHPAYPQVPPSVSVSVPQKFELYWDPTSSSLGTLLAQFQAHIEKFQGFWKVLEDFDKNVCVIQPHHPTRACTNRRIAIGKFVSLDLEINPKNPFACPKYHFLGSGNIVKPLQELFESNIHFWNANNMPRKNIENILKISFLPSDAPEASELLEACGICYAYELKDDIPSKVCDNPKCAKRYHENCLLTWFKSVQGQWPQSVGNSLIGRCPYCDRKISTASFYL